MIRSGVFVLEIKFCSCAVSEVTEFRCICAVGMLDVGTVFNVGKQKRKLFVLIDRDKIIYKVGQVKFPA